MDNVTFIKTHISFMLASGKLFSFKVIRLSSISFVFHCRYDSALFRLFLVNRGIGFTRIGNTYCIHLSRADHLALVPYLNTLFH